MWNLHVALLEVGGEPAHILVVRQERVRLGAEEVNVPHAQQSENHRDLRRCIDHECTARYSDTQNQHQGQAARSARAARGGSARP